MREVDSVIRYGGDEFIVMLLGANTKDAKVVAEGEKRYRKHIYVQRFRSRLK